MTLAKVVEVVAEGASIEAAVTTAVRGAFSSLGNASGASVLEAGCPAIWSPPV